MRKNSVWIIFFCTAIFIFGYFFFAAPAEPAGDIVEYYGATESLLNHGSLQLTATDQANLSGTLSPGFFQDGQYYVKGQDGQRYPVHFFFYSLLLLPLRLLLRLLHQPEIKTFALTNTALFFAITGLIMKKYLKPLRQSVLFFILMLLSPLLSFFIWPGADMYYLCLITFGVFAFFNRDYMSSFVAMSMASLQSSPIAVLAGGVGLFALAHTVQMHEKDGEYIFKANFSRIAILIVAGFVVLLPYIYNMLVFGTFSPWLLLANGWTKMYGVGIQNISVKKTLELMFDLNIGLLWWAPLIVLGGTFALVKGLFKKNWGVMYMALLFFLMALSYETNPSWHNGTASYGPGRYGMALLPLFVYFFVSLKLSRRIILPFLVLFSFVQLSLLGINEDYVSLTATRKGSLITFIHPGKNTQIETWSGFPRPKTDGCKIVDSPTSQSRIITCTRPGLEIQSEGITWKPSGTPWITNQLTSPFLRMLGEDQCGRVIKSLTGKDAGAINIVCRMNRDWGFLRPHFPNTAYHSYAARFVLDHAPALYEPSPEIFIDRTNHTDLDHYTTAIYKADGVCKKAFVLYSDFDKLKEECGYIPSGYGQILYNNSTEQKSDAYQQQGMYVNYL